MAKTVRTQMIDRMNATVVPNQHTQILHFLLSCPVTTTILLGTTKPATLRLDIGETLVAFLGRNWNAFTAVIRANDHMIIQTTSIGNWGCSEQGCIVEGDEGVRSKGQQEHQSHSEYATGWP